MATLHPSLIGLMFLNRFSSCANKKTKQKRRQSSVTSTGSRSIFLFSPTPLKRKGKKRRTRVFPSHWADFRRPLAFSQQKESTSLARISKRYSPISGITLVWKTPPPALFAASPPTKIDRQSVSFLPSFRSANAALKIRSASRRNKRKKEIYTITRV